MAKVQTNKIVVVLSSHTPSLFWFRMDMMEEFLARGWRVYALANEDESSWRDKFEAHGIVYRQIHVQRNGMNPFQDLKAFLSIRKELADIRPDKIFAFQAKTIIYGGIAARSLGVREFYPLIAGMGSIFLNDDLRTRLVRGIVSTEYRLALRHCPAVFFQNRDDEALFRDNRIIRGQKVVMLHGSGVSIERFQPTPLPAQPAFLCIARLIRDKGVIEYLDACRMIHGIHPEVRCMLVGPYDTNPSAVKAEDLEPYIRDGSVEYLGAADDVRPYFAQASVFVLPSYREGTPKTNLEAMACGRPVITTDAPGCKETVVDGENGFLVPVKDSRAVFEKMLWSVDHPEEIAGMGLKGRKLAEEIFDVNMVNEVICQSMGI